MTTQENVCPLLQNSKCNLNTFTVYRQHHDSFREILTLSISLGAIKDHVKKNHYNSLSVVPGTTRSTAIADRAYQMDGCKTSTGTRWQRLGKTCYAFHLDADSGGSLAQRQDGVVLGSVQPVDSQFSAGGPFHHGDIILPPGREARRLTISARKLQGKNMNCCCFSHRCLLHVIGYRR